MCFFSSCFRYCLVVVFYLFVVIIVNVGGFVVSNTRLSSNDLTYRHNRPIFPPDRNFQLKNTKVDHDFHQCTSRIELLYR